MKIWIIVSAPVNSPATPISLKLTSTNLTTLKPFKNPKRLAFKIYGHIELTGPNSSNEVRCSNSFNIEIVRLITSKKSIEPRREILAKIQATFEALFIVANDYVESTDTAKAFTASVFPFIQQYIGELTSKMGLPRLLINSQSILESMEIQPG